MWFASEARLCLSIVLLVVVCDALIAARQNDRYFDVSCKRRSHRVVCRACFGLVSNPRQFQSVSKCCLSLSPFFAFISALEQNAERLPSSC